MLEHGRLAKAVDRLMRRSGTELTRSVRFVRAQRELVHVMLRNKSLHAAFREASVEVARRAMPTTPRRRKTKSEICGGWAPIACGRWPMVSGRWPMADVVAKGGVRRLRVPR
eukprot:2330026-Prymnesium_polylepis.1